MSHEHAIEVLREEIKACKQSLGIAPLPFNVVKEIIGKIQSLEKTIKYLENGIEPEN